MNKHVKPPKAPPIDGDQMGPYIELGWQLIPLHRPADRSSWNGKPRADGKRPLDRNWTTKIYDFRKVVAAAVAQGRNVGVRLTAEQLVIDVDPRNGGDAGFDALCRDLGLDRNAWPHIVTGSGGGHYYLTKPAGEKVVDSVDQYPGVEFKSAGRQVVAAGSVHPDTMRRYEWDAFGPPLESVAAAPGRLVELISRPTGPASSEGGQHTPEEIAAMLDALDPVDFRDQDKWFRLMAACHHASGGDARTEFLEWSSRDPDYADEGDKGRRWDSLHAKKEAAITLKTLYKFLSDAGRDDAIPRPNAADDFAEDPDDVTESDSAPSATTDRGLSVNRNSVAADTIANAMRAVAGIGLKPAWDELAQKVVFRGPALPWPDEFGRELDDNVLRFIRLALIERYQGNDFQPSRDNVFESVVTAALHRCFNPVTEYLDGLKWDGVPRVGRLLSHYIDCGDGLYEQAVSTCFMVGAVRRMREPGSKFDTMPVIRSPQGWLKSTALKVLFGAPWFSDAELGDLRSKDAAMLIRGVWIVEFAEIDSLRRTELGTLKAFCSRSVDRMRDPYGRVVSDVPRRCVFVGTVNEGGFLKDPTGNRRFWPLVLRRPIDIEKIAEDRDQLWAEASALEAGGGSCELPAELWPAAAEKQAEETSTDPWADPLRAFLDQRAYDAVIDAAAYAEAIGENPPPADRVHSVELFDALGIDHSRRTKDQAQRLRTVMENDIGWRYSRGVRVGSRVASGYLSAD